MYTIEAHRSIAQPSLNTLTLTSLKFEQTSSLNNILPARRHRCPFEFYPSSCVSTPRSLSENKRRRRRQIQTKHPKWQFLRVFPPREQSHVDAPTDADPRGRDADFSCLEDAQKTKEAERESRGNHQRHVLQQKRPEEMRGKRGQDDYLQLVVKI